MAESVLFCRIAWMEHYAGVDAETEAPVHGGQWVEDGNVPWESYNFHSVEGLVYGYARPAANSRFARIERITPGVGDQVDGVRVIFFAAGPQGQVVVGWYEEATVLRNAEEGPGNARDGLPYFFIAPADCTFLIDPSARTFPIPRGKGGTGQSNWTYLLDTDGRPKADRWLYDAIDYTKSMRPGP